VPEGEGLPETGLNDLIAGAMGAWAVFEAYTKVGFTRSEALQLVIAHINAAPIPPPTPDV
jgi:hypothetical protein